MDTKGEATFFITFALFLFYFLLTFSPFFRRKVSLTLSLSLSFFMKKLSIFLSHFHCYFFLSQILFLLSHCLFVRLFPVTFFPSFFFDCISCHKNSLKRKGRRTLIMDGLSVGKELERERERIRKRVSRSQEKNGMTIRRRRRRKVMRKKYSLPDNVSFFQNVRRE